MHFSPALLTVAFATGISAMPQQGQGAAQAGQTVTLPTLTQADIQAITVEVDVVSDPAQKAIVAVADNTTLVAAAPMLQALVATSAQLAPNLALQNTTLTVAKRDLDDTSCESSGNPAKYATVTAWKFAASAFCTNVFKAATPDTPFAEAAKGGASVTVKSQKLRFDFAVRTVSCQVFPTFTKYFAITQTICQADLWKRIEWMANGQGSTSGSLGCGGDLSGANSITDLDVPITFAFKVL
ncbi:MAG: hypothetical protein M1814_005697 [Vezdaea aestivalis]|nr:MAG: hypothetical protein M1814_005697 [Vezdaea aestivalis]